MRVLKENMKKRLKTDVVIALCSSFTVCVFAPFEIYLSNKDFFFFNGFEMIPFSFLAFMALSLIILLLLITVMNIREKAHDAVLGVGFGLILAMYIQGNFLKNDYGTLDGNPIDWTLYIKEGIISVVLFVILEVIMTVLIIKLKDELFIKTIRTVAIYIFLIQLVAIVTLLIQNNGLNKESTYLATTENEMVYGSEENFVILMLDTYESTTLTRILEEDDGTYRGYLKDFVFYPDTTGMYRSTGFALPYLIGGVEYHNDCTYEEFLNKTYENSVLLNDLRNDGWYIGVYNQNRIPDSDIALKADNCKKLNLTVSSHRRLAGYMYKLVGFRYMPQPLKRFFWFYADDIASELRDTKEDVSIYGDNNFDFANAYCDMQIGDMDRSFHLYELFGAHPPYNITEDFIYSDIGTDKISACKGLLVMLDGYMNKLRETGLYENTTVIVLGDHGKEILWNPVFLVKSSGADHELEINDTPFSYAELQEIYEAISNGGGEESIKKIVYSHSTEDRRYLKFDNNTGIGKNDYFTADIYECRFSGRADNKDSLITTDTVYEQHAK